MQVAAPRTTRRTASAAPPTPARRRDGGTSTTPTLHPSPTPPILPIIHVLLHLPPFPSTHVAIPVRTARQPSGGTFDVVFL